LTTNPTFERSGETGIFVSIGQPSGGSDDILWHGGSGLIDAENQGGQNDFGLSVRRVFLHFADP